MTMNYKLISSDYRFYVSKHTKDVCLRNIETEKKLNTRDPKLPLSIINKNNAKVYIYLHNGDLRNCIKYFYKLQTLCSDLLTRMSDDVNTGFLLESEYLRFCDLFKGILDDIRNRILESYNIYMSNK